MEFLPLKTSKVIVTLRSPENEREVQKFFVKFGSYRCTIIFCNLLLIFGRFLFNSRMVFSLLVVLVLHLYMKILTLFLYTNRNNQTKKKRRRLISDTPDPLFSFDGS